MPVYWNRNKGNKYNNRKIEIDGKTFDSLKEGARIKN